MKKGSSQIIGGFHKDIIAFRWKLFIIWQVFREYRSLRNTKKIISKLLELKKKIAGDGPVNKMLKANGKYFWNMYIPGFPSENLKKHIRGEMNRIKPVKSSTNQLSLMFIGITKKCPLSCLHCYEWEEINKKDILTLSDLKKTINKFQNTGVGHIQFGGGEPMSRFDDMIELINFAKNKSDIWIATSGFNLTKERAVLLKRAGLTGVAISLDHFDPDFHNSFRGNSQAYKWAINATENCNQAGLITCWSICVTKQFISKENLYNYADEASKRHVPYIQLFEPVAVGRFKGKDITLNEKQIMILESFYYEMNTNNKFRFHPIVMYTGYYQRRIGCLGSGNRYIYIDTDGNIQSCPFCRNNNKTSIKNQGNEDLFSKIRNEGCKKYGLVEN
jgi:MoaA/NifB/PqqE/SkfB family radical SAM enzyme